MIFTCSAGGSCAKVFLDFFLFAEFHLAGDVGAFGGEHARFAAAAVAQYHVFAQQFARQFGRVHGFYRRVAGVVIQVLRALYALQFHAFFQQKIRGCR